MYILRAGGIDTSVHFASSHPANSSSANSSAVESVESVYDGTRTALYAGNTTIGQLLKNVLSCMFPL